MADPQETDTASIQSPGVQTDIHGNPTDTDIQGNRPKDAQGDEEEDFYGNPQ